MAIPNNPLVVKVAMVYRADTRHFVNTFHVADVAGWDLAKMTLLAEQFVDWWRDTFNQASSNQINLEQVQVRLLNPANPLAVDYTTGLPITGGRSSVHEPYNVTVTISWRTGLAGRKYRGRIYVPGLTEDTTNTDDTIASFEVATLAASASDLMLRMATLSADLVIFHKIDNTYTAVTTYVIDNVLDSQRRRLPGRGR
jgi:hypothetical protein